MNGTIKKVGLFVLAVILSYFTAPYIGSWYNNITPQYGNFITGAKDAMLFSGWLLSFVFFVPLIFGIFGFKKNKNWIITLLVIPVLLQLSADQYHIYIPIILSLIGFSLAWLLRKIFVRPHNLPMVVK